jgi:hypothetical protein
MTNIRHQPISALELRERLHTGFIKFSFMKKDGSLREAYGTTNLSNIPVSAHPSGNGSSSPKVVTFWDLLTSEWRSAQVTTHFFLMEN